METNTVSKERLEKDLQQIGICEGDMVYIHSSLKKIGWIDGGAQCLIEAFMNVIGKTGTLAVPTHTLGFSNLKNELYDPANTPTLLGTFPEAVRCHPDALRSSHASHSSAAIGAKAEFLIEHHDSKNALGFDSPLYRLYRSGGKILLVGVGHQSNTSLHLAESIARVGYTKVHYDESLGYETCSLQSDGTVLKTRQSEIPGCSNNFFLMEGFFKLYGITTYGKIGHAASQLLPAREMVDLTVRILHKRPDFLLCDDELCPCCGKRKQYLKQHGPDFQLQFNKSGMHDTEKLPE